MLDFFKRKNNENSLKDSPKKDDPKEEGLKEAGAGPKEERTLFSKLKQGLSRSRESLSLGLSELFLGKKEIDAEILEELESLLISADLGVEVTSNIMETLSRELSRKHLADGDALLAALKQQLKTLLKPFESPLQIPRISETPKSLPFIILMVGINGAGKTTTLGKLARKFKDEGLQVLLAAGDTFRAAAIEQLQSWGEKSSIPVIAQHTGADSASVLYDACQAAQNRSMDILLADTAGRLHTQAHLMEELKKVIRVIKKIDEKAPHEILLVLDAGIGQNSLAQAKKFHEAIGITGLILTKLDGTAKGGIVFNIANTLKLPIRFIGVGEGLEDLRVFEAEAFVEALFTK